MNITEDVIIGKRLEKHYQELNRYINQGNVQADCLISLGGIIYEFYRPKTVVLKAIVGEAFILVNL